MDSTHTALLEILEISEADSLLHIFPSIKKSLLSVGQLLNEGYYINFKIDGVKKIF